MEHLTVIYCNKGDADSKRLPLIWEGLDNATVITIEEPTTQYHVKRKREVEEAIAAETDTIIFAGHGDSHGLYAPDWLDYIIDRENVRLVKAKHVIGVWCHASDFARKNNLKGFFTSMYVSNAGEAYGEGLVKEKETDSIEQVEKLEGTIEESNNEFFRYVNTILKENREISEIVNFVNKDDRMKDAVSEFNAQGLNFFE
jgi:hypothetical protein